VAEVAPEANRLAVVADRLRVVARPDGDESKSVRRIGLAVPVVMLVVKL
jgi:hypothetical protein